MTSRTMSDAALRRVIADIPNCVNVHRSEGDGPYQSAITHYSFGPSEIPAGHLVQEFNAVLDELDELRAKLKATRGEMLTDMTAVLRKAIAEGDL